MILAELILESIDHEDLAIKQIWIDEVKSRMQAVESGQAQLLDFDERYAES